MYQVGAPRTVSSPIKAKDGRMSLATMNIPCGAQKGAIRPVAMILVIFAAVAEWFSPSRAREDREIRSQLQVTRWRAVTMRLSGWKKRREREGQ
jgi:hypothetical protein